MIGRNVIAALLLTLAPGALASPCGDRLSTLAAAAEMALLSRDASTTSRRQAQDFKNALLRTGTADAPRMVARFDERVGIYREQLTRLDSRAVSSTHQAAVASLIAEQEKMIPAYRRGLSLLDARDPTSAFRADQATQGIDVATFRQLEALVEATTRDYEAARLAATETCK